MRNPTLIVFKKGHTNNLNVFYLIVGRTYYFTTFFTKITLSLLCPQQSK